MQIEVTKQERDAYQRIRSEFVLLKENKTGKKFRPSDKTIEYYLRAARIVLTEDICPEVYVKAIFHYSKPHDKNAPWVTELVSDRVARDLVPKYLKELSTLSNNMGELEDDDSSTSIHIEHDASYTTALIESQIKAIRNVFKTRGIMDFKQKEDILINGVEFYSTSAYLKILALHESEVVYNRFKYEAICELKDNVHIAARLKSINLLHYIDKENTIIL